MKEKIIEKKKEELSIEEIDTIIKLVDKKLNATLWVLENKQPENVEKLEESVALLKGILEKLKRWTG